MEDVNEHETTSSSEESETGHGEEGRHEESELEYDQGRDISARASRNEEADRDEKGIDSSDTNGDEHGKEDSRHLSSSSSKGNVAGSDEEVDENQSMHSSASESDTDSHSESSAGNIDVEQEQVDRCSRDPSIDDLQTSSEPKDDSKWSAGTNVQEDSQNTQPSKEKNGEEEIVGDVGILGTHSPEAQSLQETQNDTGGAADNEATMPVDDVDEGSMETHSSEAEITQDTQGILDATVSTPEERNQEGQTTSSHEENKASSSNTTREIEPALMESMDQNSLESSKSGIEEHSHKGSTCDGTTEEDDDEQLKEYWTRALQTSTSTGELVEEIVKVLKHRQKTHDLLCPVCGSCVTRRVILRKRKRSSSMSVDGWFPEPVDEGETTEAVEEQEATEEYQDTEAFGCLSCFSLFFEKGRRFLNQLQADMTPESVNCLPFFFPPYPWGITQMKSRSPDRLSSEELEEAAALDVQEPAPTSAQSDYTCGIGSTILPDYPWGTMPHLSQGEAVQPANITDTVVIEEERGVSETADIKETSDRTRTCGLGTLLPDYPWGHCTTLESSGQQIQVPEMVSTAEGTTCTCGLVPALFPDYAWGRLSRVEAGPQESSSEETAPTQHEILEEVPQLHREARTCTCGLLPALLPDYPWGFCTIYEGAHTEPAPIVPQVQPNEEIRGKGEEDKGLSCASAVWPDYPWGMMTETQGLEEGPSGGEDTQSSVHVDCSSAILPSYPWGVCSADESVLEQNSSVQSLQGDAARDCTCGLGAAMLPLFPWGQTLTADSKKEEENGEQEVQSYIKQNTKIEARITSETDVITVTTSKTTYLGEKPPSSIQNVIPQKTSQTVQHVKLDQKVTIIDGSVTLEGAPPPSKVTPLVSLPSTGFALFDMADEEKGRLESKPSTGYAQLQDIVEDEPDSEIQEDPMPLKYPPWRKPKDNEQPTPEEMYHKPGKTRPELQPIGVPFPSFQWSVGKLDSGDLTTPLLQGSAEVEGETFVSVLKPTPGADESKSESWLSIFQLQKPPDKEGITSPLLPAKVHDYTEEIEEVKLPDVGPPISAASEAVIDVPPADLGGPSVETLPIIATPIPAISKKDPDGWEILKSIVYGGLDISVASLGVTSSAAGGDAITRTVVYMGLATLLSGLIGFYHNVLNLYHYHRDHYTDMVGVSLMLHGTVAIVSYVVFGLLSPLVYLFSYRKTDNRDDKFIMCCVVSIVAVTALALGKAKVSKKHYLKTVSSYLLGGVLAAIIGYLTGEHVAELLEEWGI